MEFLAATEDEKGFGGGVLEKGLEARGREAGGPFQVAPTSVAGENKTSIGGAWQLLSRLGAGGGVGAGCHFPDEKKAEEQEF